MNRAHRRCSLSKDKDGIVTRETLTAHWTGGIDCRSVDFFDNDTMTLVEVTL
ncbi:MAG: hypothetical protein IT565_03975 [Rhodospirillales bacterium]|nr:hypothetical protein [Rhodospirillales bacterium]